jgi:hypothetical protein
MLYDSNLGSLGMKFFRKLAEYPFEGHFYTETYIFSLETVMLHSEYSYVQFAAYIQVTIYFSELLSQSHGTWDQHFDEPQPLCLDSMIRGV